MTGAPFANRRDAGRQLAARLGGFAGPDTLVLALPRGGVPVAFEVARALAAELDVAMVRKIGAPGQEELGIGAVMNGAEPVLDEAAMRIVRPPPGYVEAEVRRARAEIARRRLAYLGDRRPPDVSGRTVVVVDDGVATGSSARAVLRALRRFRAGRLVLAVPVGPPDSLAMLAGEADGIVCLRLPASFGSVGAHYVDFTQTTDDEVIRLLHDSGRTGP